MKITIIECTPEDLRANRTFSDAIVDFLLGAIPVHKEPEKGDDDDSQDE